MGLVIHIVNLLIWLAILIALYMGIRWIIGRCFSKKAADQTNKGRK